ncbi:MAG: glutaredoxin domain-containing protein [Myxococcales bacterium]|jgi:glutaredoxin
MSRRAISRWLSVVLLLAACGNPVPAEDPGAGAPGPASGDAPAATRERGEPVKPPFAVEGDAEGLMLVWFDEQGVHGADRRSQIPPARRAMVRVKSLSVPPDQRLDPEHVYVADLRKPGPDGSYPVVKHSRAFFDAQVDAARPAQAADVVIYKASWCGVCRSAAAYLRSRGVDFVEKDVEKDPGAQQEMQRKARAAGKTPRGVPVIDFDGEILLGFDKARLAQLIDAR